MPFNNVLRKTKIDTKKFVDTSTGETLFSQLPNTTSINQIDPNHKILNSFDYIIIDSKALSYIQEIFSNCEIAKIIRLSNMVKGKYNLLHDIAGNVHTTTTLRTTLRMDESSFSKFKKMLERNSIISLVSSNKNEKKSTLIMFNPTLARKNKMFHNDCLTVFDDLTKKYKS